MPIKEEQKYTTGKQNRDRVRDIVKNIVKSISRKTKRDEMKRRRGNGRKIESIDFERKSQNRGQHDDRDHEMEHVFEENGVEYETIQVGKMDIRGCAACGTCYKNGKCMFVIS